MSLSLVWLRTWVSLSAESHDSLKLNKGVLPVSVPFVIYFNNYNPK